MSYSPCCLVNVFFVSFCCSSLFAAEIMPPRPTRHFNDYARVVSTETASRLDKSLEDFERETSNQILVAVFPKMQSDSSIEDYTVRIAESWKTGQKGRDNGAILFVFVQDRKMFLQVGYGLEGALPDALAKQIIENDIKPRFRSVDYEGGLTAGVAAILAATRGEYKGTGQTAAQRQQQQRRNPGNFAVLAGFVGFMIILALLSRRSGVRRRGWVGQPGGWVLTSGGYSPSRNWPGSDGGFSGGGGGGGYSGGGGSFGGGGAGGSW